MRLALHWRTLGASTGLEALLDAAAAAGFVGVEAGRQQIVDFAERRPNSHVVRLFGAAGLCQTATALGVDLEAPEPEFRPALEGIERIVYIVRGLTSFGAGQAAVLVRAPSGAPGAGPRAEAVAGRLRRVAALLAAAGLTVLLDPADPTAPAPTWARPQPDPDVPADVARLVEWTRRAEAGNVGLVVDLWRWPALAAAGADPGTTAETLAPLRGLPLLGRLADVPQSPPEAPAGVPRLLPGEGGRDLAGAVRALRALGYDGYWSVEVAGLAADAGAAARRCLHAAERVVRDALRYSGTPAARGE